MSTVIERARRSVQRLLTVVMSAVLPFSSARAIGVAEIPNRVGVTIWISGNARPMPSASTNGILICAATLNGVVELRPPASIETVCVIGRPRYSPSSLNARMISSPLGSFSTITVGAPIIADGTTSASSGTSSMSTRDTGPCSRIACWASSLPMYGLPPPPVPSTAAPMARSSRSCSVTCRNAFCLQLKFTDSLDSDPGGAAGQVAQRHLLDVDDMNGFPVSAGGNSLVDRLLLRLFQGLVARFLLKREDAVHLAADLSDRGADRVGHREVLGLDQLRSAGQPIAQQDAAAADHHDRDRLSARLHAIDRRGDAILHQLERALDQVLVEARDEAAVANVREPARDGDVGGCQRVASKAQSL